MEWIGASSSCWPRSSGGRGDGYRIHVNPVGARALHACLPAPAWREFLATAGPGGDVGFLTSRLDELVVIEESIMYPGGAGPTQGHYAADRTTQAASGGAVAAWGVRSWFRLCAAVPALRRRAFAGEWTSPAAPRDWELTAA